MVPLPPVSPSFHAFAFSGSTAACKATKYTALATLHPAFPPSQRSAFGIAMLVEKANVPSPTLGSPHKGVCVCRGWGGGGCGEWSFAFRKFAIQTH